MAKRYAEDEQLMSYPVKNWLGGYNSYTASKSSLDDNEIPLGRNVVLDDNGSVTKTAGVLPYGEALPGAVMGMGWLKNDTHNKVLVASGTAIYNVAPGVAAPLTGVSFTPGNLTYFCQALDRMYIANGVDPLCYTSDGASIAVQATGKVGTSPVFFAQRLYLIESSTGRIWFSNPFSVTTEPPDLTIGNFGMFDTELPTKNASFIELIPGGGVEPVRLRVVNGSTLRVYTKANGMWEIAAPTVDSTTGVVNHTVTQRVVASGTPSPFGVALNGNDEWWWGGDGIYSYGEVAQYQSQRKSNKSGRIRSELDAITPSGKDSVALETFKDNLYIAYQSGSLNDRIFRFDNALNAYSAPIDGVSATTFLSIEDDDGTPHFLAGSADADDPYVYELETGSSFAGNAIDAFFETKSLDCGKPGLMKRFGFIDVFYSLVLGVLTYQVFIDETEALTGSLQLGSSATGNVGFGTLMFGTFPMGLEYQDDATSATVATNDSFRIECDYSPGTKISVRFSNATTGEQFKIDSLQVYYLPGSVYEQ